MLDVTFYGVRGSTPCSCDTTNNIGGNTSCVLVRGPEGDDPIVLDLGTGLRYLGNELMAGPDHTTFAGTALVTHLHWDHVQGIPFFVPLLRENANLRLIGPEQPGSDLKSEISSFIRPPLFPVDLSILPCEIEFIEMSSGRIDIGSSTVTVASIEHVGPTNGYRIDNGDASVVYIPDHQQPVDGSLDVPASVVEFCRGADLLIHDAQYDADEFASKATWGHSTVRYAAEVAKLAGVRRLVLFHHDPSHNDAWIAQAVRDAQGWVGAGTEVMAASEGLQLRSGHRLAA
ncbi:MAG: MBL fold metallo-hydrolase [Acidimicrobiales bacterium]